ncbi:hypothetical protein A4X13_0g8861 [Tilletia indica]|uniref:Uncharacterized protein n=1 Tax=Tilletia indica TaxID=43049 RepID=A0A177T754_9BASI|nr:hypothetical protein A4X13_0g8861 [Tilletia indica]
MLMAAVLQTLEKDEQEAKVRLDMASPGYNADKRARELYEDPRLYLGHTLRLVDTTPFLLLERALRFVEDNITAGTQVEPGFRAYQEALADLLQAMALRSADLAPGWTRVLLERDPAVVAMNCGDNPASKDGTTCRVCGPWNPSGLAKHRTG